MGVYLRKCDNCGQGMNDGYVWGDGQGYACSNKCLFVDGYTREQYRKDLENDDIYYSEWDDFKDEIELHGGFYVKSGEFVELQIEGV